MTAHLEWLVEGRDDALRDEEGTLARRLLEEERELVTAEAAGGVLGAQHRLQPLRDQAQQLVAGRVAERVVDGLELVEVDEQDRDPLLGAPDERVAEAVDEEDAVGQPGERIVERLVPELVLEVFPVADVDEDALHHGGPAVRVARDHRLVVDDPHDPPVAGEQPVLPPALRLGALGVLRFGHDHPVAIGRMHAVDPERGIGRPLLGCVAEQLVDLGADEVPPAVLPGLGDVDDARHPLDDRSVLRLGNGELVAELPLTADDALAIGQEDGLARDRAHQHESQREAGGHAHPAVDQGRLRHHGDRQHERERRADQGQQLAQPGGDRGIA